MRCFFCETREKDAGPGNSLEEMLLKKCTLSGVIEQRGQRDNSQFCNLMALCCQFPVVNFHFLDRFYQENSRILQEGSSCNARKTHIIKLTR